ncbi:MULTISPECIES: type II toxin-antitoxin system YafQ family toxin [Providencia]|nr:MULTISPECIES: type II toxin-antitoxin system YafQ family toxin [Providencia]NIH24217.1 type II toxin-antitoxin system YafQ family toxin [Providencia heimbachae]
MQKLNSKRAKQPRQIAYTSAFKKSWERYNKAGRRDMNEAVIIMEILFSQKTIPAQYFDHELEGSEWKGARELHIGGDFLLVYRLSDNTNLVTFIDIGSHSELFG